MESATTELLLLSNQSSESCPAVDATVENSLFGCFYIVVFFLALNGNSLALWIFSHQRGSSSPSTIFLIHLAVADLILHRGSRLEPALKLKALRTIGVVLLIYVVCFLPYHASRATFILGYNHPGVSCQSRRGLSLANRLTSSLTCLNGAMDPLIYLFGAEKFRGTLVQLFCKDKAGLSAATSGELKGTRESSVSARSEF